MTDTLRRCIFKPYRPGMGPIFWLHMWDTGRIDSRGSTVIGYTLKRQARKGAKLTTLFEGEDFSSSPCNAVDSDKTVVGLMGFLTLKPGDTDPDYFKDYTPEQLAFCSSDAESLGFEVTCRYGED